MAGALSDNSPAFHVGHHVHAPVECVQTGTATVKPGTDHTTNVRFKTLLNECRQSSAFPGSDPVSDGCRSVALYGSRQGGARATAFQLVYTVDDSYLCVDSRQPQIRKTFKRGTTYGACGSEGGNDVVFDVELHLRSPCQVVWRYVRNQTGDLRAKTGGSDVDFMCTAGCIRASSDRRRCLARIGVYREWPLR